MANDLAAVKQEIHRADVVFHGEKLVLPATMKPETAIGVLTDFVKSQEQVVRIERDYKVFPWDGAIGLGEVLKKHFGWVSIQGQMGMFSRKPPTFIQIEVAPGKVQPAMWGEFSIPTSDGGLMACAVHGNDGHIGFRVVATLKKKDESLVNGLLQDLEEYLKTSSIYRGKAIKLQLSDSNGRHLDIPEIKHVDTSKVSRDQLVLSSDVRDAVETNLFTPIERIKELADNGLPVKRGVLLGGTFGTGKSLTAAIAAKLAVDNGITFIYVNKASDLVEAVKLAEMYQSPASVVFCEDIDRELRGEDRTVEMDAILNIIDGIDTKYANIMVVLTTNEMGKINKAMMRFGRLDAVIEVTPPDAEAIEKLVRYYGRGLVSDSTDLSRVGKVMEGCIPAAVAEMVKRAKLSQLRLQPAGMRLTSLSEEALCEAARTMRNQLELMKPPALIKEEPWFERTLQRAISTEVEKVFEEKGKKIALTAAEYVLENA